MTAVVLGERLAGVRGDAAVLSRGGFLTLGSVPLPSFGMSLGFWEGKLGMELTKHIGKTLPC